MRRAEMIERIAQLEAEKAALAKQVSELTGAVKDLSAKVQPSGVTYIPYTPQPAIPQIWPQPWIVPPQAPVPSISPHNPLYTYWYGGVTVTCDLTVPNTTGCASTFTSSN
jgi:hypothetical protein